VPSYDLTGTVKLIMDMQTFGSGFTKREFVVTTQDDRFPQDIKFECVKDKCDLLEAIEPGQEVKVSFDLRGNEYKERYTGPHMDHNVVGTLFLTKAGGRLCRLPWFPARVLYAAGSIPVRNQNCLDSSGPTYHY